MTITPLLVCVNQSILLVDSQDYYQHPSEDLQLGANVDNIKP
jgi:hypothetical protein